MILRSKNAISLRNGFRAEHLEVKTRNTARSDLEFFRVGGGAPLFEPPKGASLGSRLCGKIESGRATRAENGLASNHAPHAPSFFDHVLRDAFAPIGAFHERPHVVLALASRTGQQNIRRPLRRNEFVWTTW